MVFVTQVVGLRPAGVSLTRSLSHTDQVPGPGSVPPLRIAMMGTRGVPAAYGGFETAVEEVGRRLTERGHEIVVYCREKAPEGEHYLQMKRVVLPALRKKTLETLSHTALSAAHAMARSRPDVAFVFNAANSPFVFPLRAARVPTALHMDGIEWRRAKWSGLGREYYRRAEQWGVRSADALIADAPGIADYYTDQFGVPTELIRYGAPQLATAPDAAVRALGFEPGGYHLVVARFEPENHVREIVAGYRRSSATMPLVVVGSAPYSADYTTDIDDLAIGDERINLVGGVFDQDLLDALYFHAFTYLHGHSVGGTNPSLLRAIGAGTAVIAYDVTFNREVLDQRGWFFKTADDVTKAVEDSEADPRRTVADGTWLQERAAKAFDWEDVAAAYEDLAVRLANGYSTHSQTRRAKRSEAEWVG